MRQRELFAGLFSCSHWAGASGRKAGHERFVVWRESDDFIKRLLPGGGGAHGVSDPSPLDSASPGKPAGRKTPSFRERVDRVCERGILGAVLAILVWGPLAYGAVRVNPDSAEVPHLYGLLVIQGLTALAVVLWAARFFTQRPFRLLWPPICWAVLAFVLYAIVRCQMAELEYAARQNLQCVILYGALFFVIVNNFNRRESATTAALVLIAVGLGGVAFRVLPVSDAL